MDRHESAEGNLIRGPLGIPLGGEKVSHFVIVCVRERARACVPVCVCACVRVQSVPLRLWL